MKIFEEDRSLASTQNDDDDGEDDDDDEEEKINDDDGEEEVRQSQKLFLARGELRERKREGENRR